MEETSRLAWDEHKGSEDYLRSRRIILNNLTDVPMTAMELCSKANYSGLWKRLREMERENLIEVCNKKICTVTGKSALTWKLKPDISQKIKNNDGCEQVDLFES